MGRQVNYFIDEQDLSDLLAWLESSGFLAVRERGLSGSTPELITPRTCAAEESAGTVDVGTSWASICLIPPACSNLRIAYGPSNFPDGKSALSPDTFPTVEFSPVKVDPSGWARGRIYFSCHPNRPQYREGVNGYERIARMLRKWPRFSNYRQRYRVGPHLAQRIRSGEVAGPIGYGEILDA